MSIINAANHALSLFSGTALEATVDTAEQELEAGRRVRVRGFRPLTDAGIVYGSIGARETTQAAASYSNEQLVTGSGTPSLTAFSTRRRSISRVVATVPTIGLSAATIRAQRSGGKTMSSSHKKTWVNSRRSRNRLTSKHR
jgi:hypothetical protein